MGQAEEPDQDDRDGGVLADKVDERDDDAGEGREAPHGTRALKTVGEVVLDRQVPVLLPYPVEFDAEDDDTEGRREGDEELLPDRRPPGREAEAADAEEGHARADRGDHQDGEDPEAERPAGDDVVLGVVDLLRGPCSDGQEDDEVEADDPRGDWLYHASTSLKRKAQARRRAVTEINAVPTIATVSKGSPIIVLC